MISLVTGVAGAGISTWAASEAITHGQRLLVSAPSGRPGVISQRIGGLAAPASGEFGMALAQLTGIPAAALDDAITSSFADVVALSALSAHDGSEVADLGAWTGVASGVSQVERFAAHCAAVTPQVAGLGGDASAFLAIMELSRRLRELGAWLADPCRVQITYVTTPDPHGVEAATRAMSAARLLGVRVKRIVVNRCLMDLDCESVWGRGRSTQQDCALQELGDLAREVGCGMATAVEMPCSLATALSMRELWDTSRIAVQGDPKAGDGPPRGSLRAPPGCSAQPVDGGYELSIPVGYCSEGVAASRRGDALLVEAGGVQRQLQLGGALARCDISHGRRVGEWLVLKMTPDPRLWPRGDDTGCR